MPDDHPFQQLFETFGKLPEAHSESVNREARESLKGWLDTAVGKPGHCILLKAPRAGHGKTHLLTRIQHELGGSHEFIPLHAIGGSRIDAATVLDDTLRRLTRGLPAAGGLTVLDLVARRLFSTSLQPLVNSGEVPCQDREGALVALRDRPIETFDFHHPGAVTAHWAKENFELLGPRLALELSQRHGISLREVSFWVDAMFHFAATPIDNPGRVRALVAEVFDSPTAESSAHERLVALLGLLTSLLRVVLVADELEGFSLDESAALRFASFIGSLRQSVERADVILSVNQDVWESAFLPRLSGGLADRLSEVTVEIGPLDRAGMIAVIESRAPGEGEKIIAALSSNHARGVIREAAGAWSRKAESEPESPVMVTKPEAPVFIDTPPAPIYPEPSPVNAPTRFFPEAAIAAFNAIHESSAAHVNDTPPAPAPPAADFSGHSWPSPDATPTAVSAQTKDRLPPAPPTAEDQPHPVVPEMDSPFMIGTASETVAPPFQQQKAAAAARGDEPFQTSPAPPDEASTDRVDELLRQFRERYGKS
jgi:hypothetical protein